jgi:hypothetical protein
MIIPAEPQFNLLACLTRSGFLRLIANEAQIMMKNNQMTEQEES